MAGKGAKKENLAAGKSDPKMASAPKDRIIDPKDKSLGANEKAGIKTTEDKKTKIKDDSSSQNSDGKNTKDDNSFTNGDSKTSPWDNISLKRGESLGKITQSTKLFQMNYRLGISYLNRQIQSQDQIKVTNTNEYYTIEVAMELIPYENKSFGDYLGIDISIGPSITDSEFDIPSYKEASLYYSYPPKNLEANILAGLSYSEINFTNLDQIGLGLRPANSKLFWLLVGAEKKYDFLERKHHSRITIEKSYLSFSTYGTKGDSLSMSGIQINLSQLSQVYLNYLASISYQFGLYNSRTYDIEASLTGFKLTLWYQF